LSSLLLKVVLTPALIATATLAERRWGVGPAFAFPILVAALIQGVTLRATRQPAD
jgi:hypothetical protein